MGTLTGLMWLSRSALQAEQSAIDATAQNVANQNTVGYTRKVVSFAANDQVSIGGTHFEAGSVSATAVSQRDRVLERRLQQATQTSAASTARLGALQGAETLFGLSSTSSSASTTAIGSAMDGFFASLTSLSANPNESATRGGVLTAANTLAAAFNSTSAGLKDQASALNEQIATIATQINGLTKTIAQLNQQITSISPDQDAGGLEDRRQEAIKQLSSIVGVNQITAERNSVTLTTSNGVVLVSGSSSFDLGVTAVAGKTELSAGNPPTPFADIQGGALAGLMQARDKDIPAMQASIDQLAFAVGSAVNDQNASGKTSTGVAGGAVFNLPSDAMDAAAQMSVVLSSSQGIATASAGEGSSGTGNAIALANLGSAKILNGISGANFFADFLGGVGNTVSGALWQSNADSATLSQAQTQRDSLSGVSLDEEAAALTQYQRAYEAAAKIFAVVDKMMAAAMNLGQETAVS